MNINLNLPIRPTTDAPALPSLPSSRRTSGPSSQKQQNNVMQRRRISRGSDSSAGSDAIQKTWIQLNLQDNKQPHRKLANVAAAGALQKSLIGSSKGEVKQKKANSAKSSNALCNDLQIQVNLLEDANNQLDKYIKNAPPEKETSINQRRLSVTTAIVNHGNQKKDIDKKSGHSKSEKGLESLVVKKTDILLSGLIGSKKTLELELGTSVAKNPEKSLLKAINSLCATVESVDLGGQLIEKQHRIEKRLENTKALVSEKTGEAVAATEHYHINTLGFSGVMQFVVNLEACNTLDTKAFGGDSFGSSLRGGELNYDLSEAFEKTQKQLARNPTLELGKNAIVSNVLTGKAYHERESVESMSGKKVPGGNEILLGQGVPPECLDHLVVRYQWMKNDMIAFLKEPDENGKDKGLIETIKGKDYIKFPNGDRILADSWFQVIAPGQETEKKDGFDKPEWLTPPQRIREDKLDFANSMI